MEQRIFEVPIWNPKRSRGGTRCLPYAFTEQGVAMLSSILRSERAVQVNIAIMRAFVTLRGLLASDSDSARRILRLEEKFDKQFALTLKQFGNGSKHHRPGATYGLSGA